jgi:serine O-acetyltransferase
MLALGLIRSAAAEIRRDVAVARSRDPAARGVGTVEVLVTWPGVQALLAHRTAHALQRVGIPLLPRVIAGIARSVTGIEIHPAAGVGKGFFIDHGMGVVIGETAQIGNDVTLYQGVTLGGTGFATGKRHPTVQDNVTIGSGAKLLGPITIGHGAKVGANTVVIHDVPPHSTVVGNPGHPVRIEGRRPEGPDADWIHLPDPVADAIRGLSSRIAALESEAAERAERERGLGSDRAREGSEGRKGEANVEQPDPGGGQPGDGGARVDGGRRPAGAGRQPDGRANPAVGPNPAGG